jgi:predicted DsbA family dithiol-disulfide isomerase
MNLSNFLKEPYIIYDRKVAIHGAREVEVFEKALGG